MNEQIGLAERLRKDPMYGIGVILATILAIFAIYFMGPWYAGTSTSAIGAAFDSQIVRLFLGSLYLTASIGTFLGIENPKHRRWSLFGLTLAYLFLTGLRLVFIGPLPFIWLFSMGMAMISGVVYLVSSLNPIDDGGTKVDGTN